jgi:hypothetical protein
VSEFIISVTSRQDRCAAAIAEKSTACASAMAARSGRSGAARPSSGQSSVMGVKEADGIVSRGGGGINNGLHVPLERPDAVLVHPVAQELHGSGGEHVLPRVDLQAVLLKDGEDLLEVLVVLLQCVAGDDEVVQVAEHEGQAFE